MEPAPFQLHQTLYLPARGIYATVIHYSAQQVTLLDPEGRRLHLSRTELPGGPYPHCTLVGKYPWVEPPFSPPRRKARRRFFPDKEDETGQNCR